MKERKAPATLGIIFAVFYMVSLASTRVTSKNIFESTNITIPYTNYLIRFQSISEIDVYFNTSYMKTGELNTNAPSVMVPDENFKQRYEY